MTERRTNVGSDNLSDEDRKAMDDALTEWVNSLDDLPDEDIAALNQCLWYSESRKLEKCRIENGQENEQACSCEPGECIKGWSSRITIK